MIKLKTIVLLMTFGATCMSFRRDKEPDFRITLDKFLSKCSTHYELVQNHQKETVLVRFAENISDTTLILKARNSFINSGKQKVFPRIRLSFFEYGDESTCLKAKEAVLKCFGGDCAEVIWGQEKAYKVTPSIYIFNKKQIIVAKVWCEHENEDWTKFKEDLTQSFGEDGSGIIQTGCGGPTKFREL